MAKGLLKKVERKLIRFIPKRSIHIKMNQPIISITFDDFPASAVGVAMKVLNEHGLLATYFLASGLIDKINDDMEICSEADVIGVANAGHEIACHTFSHFNCNNVTAKSIDTLESELLKNAQKIKKLVGIAPCSFSYPFGGINFVSRNLISKKFFCARSIDHGVNFGKIDFLNLKANKVYSENFSLTKFDELLTTAKQKNGWVILYTHDVSSCPTPYGCTIDQFRSLIQLIVNSGIKVLPIKNVIEELQISHTPLAKANRRVE